MKRILVALIGALMLSLALVGCGGGEEKTEAPVKEPAPAVSAPSEESKTEEPPVVETGPAALSLEPEAYSDAFGKLCADAGIGLFVHDDLNYSLIGAPVNGELTLAEDGKSAEFRFDEADALVAGGDVVAFALQATGMDADQADDMASELAKVDNETAAAGSNGKVKISIDSQGITMEFQRDESTGGSVFRITLA